MTDITCVICNILHSKQKCFIVFEDNDYLVFLDHRPLFKGHCLLAPKTHIKNIYQLPEMLASSFTTTIQKIGNAVQKAMSAEGTFIAINNDVSQSIPHLHVHIVPRNKGDGLKGFFWPRTKYKDEAEMEEVRLAIKKYV